MPKQLLLLCALLMLNVGLCQDKVKYLFSNDFNKKQELVLIVKEPQSQLATEIGSRLYSNDYALIIKKNFIDTTTYPILEWCGFDMFFYLKSGRNLRPIAKINSTCANEYLTKSNIDLLKMGKQLETDTVVVNSLNKGQFLKKSVIHLVNNSNDYRHETTVNSVSFPEWYYDFWFQVEIESEQTLDIIGHMEKFCRKMGIKDVIYRDVNWLLDSEQVRKINVFDNTYPKPDMLKFKVYFKHRLYKYFKSYELKHIAFPLNRTIEYIVFRKK